MTFYGGRHLDRSGEFPENYRQLISHHLQEKYGDKISIRSTIVYPPVEERKMVGGKEIVSFVGKVRYVVVDRRDEDFGMHELTYVIQNNQVSSMEEEL